LQSDERLLQSLHHLSNDPGRAIMNFAERTGIRERTDWPRVGLGVALGAFSAYQQFKLPPILPDFLARYPHDPITAAGFMSVYALVGLLVSAPIGRRLDQHIGRGVTALLILTVIGVTVALVAPQSGPAMLVSRAIEGLAFAFGAIAGPAIATGAANPRDLPLVTGLLAGWIPMGQILAALLALAIDWRGLWIIGLVGALPMGIWAWRLLGQEPRRQTAARPPARQPDGTERRQLILAGTTFLLWSAQYFAFMTWLTQYLTGTLALSRTASVLAYLTPVVVLLGCNVLTGIGLRHRLPLVPALIAALIAQAGVWLAQPWLSGAVGVLGLVVYGIGAGVTPTCLFHTPHAIAHAKHAGHAAGAAFFGILMTGRNIGVFIGPILLAWLIGHERYALGLGWTDGARIMAAVTLLSAAVAAGLWRALHRDRLR
jgi:predicted MFS family arabinose efflux permease